MAHVLGGDAPAPSSDGEAPTRIVAVDAVGRGMVLAGKYEVDRVLGQGGMGVVVAAKSLADGGRVALKFLIDEAAKDADAVERFQREARSASQIPNPHVTRVIETGYLDHGAPFIVMELLQGQDLGQLLEQSKRLPIPLAIDYVLQALEAIGAAHLLGIVHRDLKPANLFLTQDGSGQPLVKVLDFGLSKDIGSRDSFSLTQTSTGAMGTPLYMAPEQVKSAKHATFASDIWSIGVVVHELVSGDIPFDGANLGALLGAILSEPPKPLRASLATAPPELEAVVQRCLRKAQADRPRDVLELARLLAPFASPAGVRSVDNIRAAYEAAGRPTGFAGDATMQSRSTPDRHAEVARTSDGPRGRPRWAFTSDPAKQRRRGALAASAVVVGVLVAGGLLVRARLVASADAGGADAAAGPSPEVAPPPSPPLAPTPTIVVAPVSPPDALPSSDAEEHTEPPTPDASASTAPPSPSAKAAPPRASTTSRPAPPPAPAPPRPSGSPSLDELLKRGRR